MGTPKAMLDAGGRTFLERVIHALHSGGCARVLVALPTPKGPVAAKAGEAGAVVVTNPAPEDGPIGSLRAALRTLDPAVEGLAYCPVDYPLLQADTVRSLLLEFHSSQRPLALPTFREKRGHPVVFRRTVFEELLDDDLPQGAKTVVHRHLDVAALVPVEDEGSIIDIDDLTDYRRHFPDAYRKRFHAR
jgi:molybdenum cofactor cytidylyltransferase